MKIVLDSILVDLHQIYELEIVPHKEEVSDWESVV